MTGEQRITADQVFSLWKDCGLRKLSVESLSGMFLEGGDEEAIGEGDLWRLMSGAGLGRSTRRRGR